MAASLMNIENIQVNLVPDSNIFNLMSRANKVVIGTHLVYSDGGLQTIAGVYNLAVTAKYFSVPVRYEIKFVNQNINENIFLGHRFNLFVQACTPNHRKLRSMSK